MNNSVRTLARIACAFLFAGSAAAADPYAKAARVGEVKGLTDVGCKGGFIDAAFKCWKCPDGFKHDDILKPPEDPRVCKDEGGRSKREGTKHDAAKVAIPPCPSGQWLSTHNGYCYSCPGGYNHDGALFGNVDGVCWKDNPDRYSKAVRMSGSAFCEKSGAFPDPDGSCYACPAANPVRVVRYGAKSEKACASAACGFDGGRPCQVAERVPSCDAGMLEDPVNDRCLPNAAWLAACKATVNSLKAGKVPAIARPFLQQAMAKTKANTPQVLDEAKKKGLAFIEANKGAIPEVQRLHALMQSQRVQMDRLFDEDVLCSPSALKAMVLGPAKALVTPNYHGNFYLAHTLVGSAAAEAGVVAGLTLAMDFKLVNNVPALRHVGIFGWVGPQLVTNVTAGISRGIQFFPVTTLDGFSGWGWGLGMSVGIPTLKVVGGGADISFGTSLLPIGFGASIGVGAGVLPADGSISATYAWPLWTTNDLTDDAMKVIFR